MGNDYTWLEERLHRYPRREGSSRLGVSIVVPVYNRRDMLAKTLAALTHQTYPNELVEILIADDGSRDGVEQVVASYEHALDLTLVSQPDQGYRLAAVRNLAMRAARHPFIILLDCDTMPVPTLVEAYMRVFHISDRVVLLGHRRFVDAADVTADQIRQDARCITALPDMSTANPLFSRGGRGSVTLDWRLEVYARTARLKQAVFPFRCLVGANTAYPKAGAEAAGGFCEEFRAWGHEDAEFGYRLYNAGYFFMPLLSAVGLHQEPPPSAAQVDRRAGLRETAVLMAEKCPAPMFRPYDHGRVYEIPKVSVLLRIGEVGVHATQIDSVLSQSWTDLELVIIDRRPDGDYADPTCVPYRNDQRVRWLRAGPRRLEPAWAEELGLCRGLYVVHLTAGIVLEPSSLHAAVEHLDRHDVDCVWDTTGPRSPDRERTVPHGDPIDGVGRFSMARRREWIRIVRSMPDGSSEQHVWQRLRSVWRIHLLNEMRASAAAHEA